MELKRVQTKNEAMTKEFAAEMKEIEKEMEDEEESDYFLHPHK